MGQTLTNGIYLPAEGEVRCYNGLASNWTTLDSVVGGYRAHVANEDIHITSEERGKWDTGVTQAYVLRYANTSLTALGTVAFSALDNTDNIKIGDKVLDSEGKLFALTAVDTANTSATLSALLIDLSKDSDLSNYYTKGETDTLLSDKADDTGVLHKTGNESKNGELTVSKVISNNIVSETGNVVIQSAGSNRAVSIYNGSSAGDGAGFWAYGKDHPNGSDCRMQIYNTEKSRYERVDLVNSALIPNPSGELDCGKTTNKYKTFNGVAPGLLSFPDLNNGVDISSYISVTSGQTVQSTYTAPADGWIYVNLGRSSGSIGLILSNGSISISIRENTFLDAHRECPGFLPVFKSDTVSILSCLADSIRSAYFYPCLGNI